MSGADPRWDVEHTLTGRQLRHLLIGIAHDAIVRCRFRMADALTDAAAAAAVFEEEPTADDVVARALDKLKGADLRLLTEEAVAKCVLAPDLAAELFATQLRLRDVGFPEHPEDRS